jgi:hypothetical protein
MTMNFTRRGIFPIAAALPIVAVLPPVVTVSGAYSGAVYTVEIPILRDRDEEGVIEFRDWPEEVKETVEAALAKELKKLGAAAKVIKTRYHSGWRNDLSSVPWQYYTKFTISRVE